MHPKDEMERSAEIEVLDTSDELDVVIVGAGAAGVGMGVVLRDLGVERFRLPERHEVGASFLRWPAETRLLTPSFPGQGFGAMDLNAVALMTSPGFTTEREHLSGALRSDADFAIHEYRTLHDAVAALLRARIPAEARVLAAGARTETELPELAHAAPGWHFTGVDPSPAILGHASARSTAVA
jgi:flavin-dependent dehydrogenase